MRSWTTVRDTPSTRCGPRRSRSSDRSGVLPRFLFGHQHGRGARARLRARASARLTAVASSCRALRSAMPPWWKLVLANVAPSLALDRFPSGLEEAADVTRPRVVRARAERSADARPREHAALTSRSTRPPARAARRAAPDRADAADARWGRPRRRPRGQRRVRRRRSGLAGLARRVSGRVPRDLQRSRARAGEGGSARVLEWVGASQSDPCASPAVGPRPPSPAPPHGRVPASRLRLAPRRRARRSNVRSIRRASSSSWWPLHTPVARPASSARRARWSRARGVDGRRSRAGPPDIA